MTYTGAVTVGGPADVHELSGLVISKLAVGPYENNAYLLRCRTTGEQLLIDAAADAPAILDLIGDDGIAGIVTTHQHEDHWQALADVISATGARTYAHADDAGGIGAETDVFLADGDTLMVGAAPLRVIHLAGHTPGGLALVYDDPHGFPHIFTGDSLFPGGVGKTTDDTFGQLIDDVEKKVFGVLPDETWVYPGHGGDTTLGAERPHLDEWRARGW